MLATILLTLTLQTPQAPDVIKLVVGDEIEGQIVRETEDYVEIRVGNGMVVGFEKSKAAAIVRGRQAQERAEDAAAPEPKVDSDEWFVLHDGLGRSVGWLHANVSCDADTGGMRISEEWNFSERGRTTQLTVLETLDRAGRPASCFYHERVRDSEERVRSERLIRGVVQDDQLEVQARSMQGATRRSYAFRAGSRFPLELRRSLGGSTQRRIVEFDVFDPASEEWARESFDIGESRTVESEGARYKVRVLRESTSRGTNVRWLDAAAKCVRREVNGSALVAMPVSEARARQLSRDRVIAFPPGLVADNSGRFAMWLPNPLWEVVSGGHGEVSVRSSVFDATMSLVLLDQFGERVLVESAADSVERWMRISHPNIRFDPREHTAMRDARAVRLRGEYELRSTGGVTRRRCDIVVFEHESGGFLSFCADAPTREYDQLAGDFERTLDRIESRKADVVPEQLGAVGKR